MDSKVGQNCEKLLLSLALACHMVSIPPLRMENPRVLVHKGTRLGLCACVFYLLAGAPGWGAELPPATDDPCSGPLPRYRKGVARLPGAEAGTAIRRDLVGISWGSRGSSPRQGPLEGAGALMAWAE